MAAAASLREVSPELALVDSALAAELRAALVAPAPNVEGAAHATEDVARDDERVERGAHSHPDTRNPVDASDLIVEHAAGAAKPSTTHALPEEDVTVDVLDHGGDAPDRVDASDLIVATREGHPGDRRATSWYPSLPAPEDVETDSLDVTEATLREIRARLTAPAELRPSRRFRRRFTVLSGASTLCALGFLATNLLLGTTQLPV